MICGQMLPSQDFHFVQFREAPLTQETMTFDKVVTRVNVSVSLIIENMLLHFSFSVCSVLHCCLNHFRAAVDLV